jgi:hypothetical protein
MRIDDSPELETYRAQVRAFIAQHHPGVRRHVGVRAPDPGQLPALRAWVAGLYAAGVPTPRLSAPSSSPRRSPARGPGARSEPGRWPRPPS